MRFLFYLMKDLFIEFPLSDKCLALTTTTCLGNMAYQVDEGKDVLKHRHLLADSLNIPLSSFTYVRQHHSDIIKEVTISDVGKGVNSFADGLECDALYTKLVNVPLCIFHADCVPIFFIYEKVNLVGIIHAGYKGTLKHVAYKTIKQVLEDEHLDIKDFKFYIGPYRLAKSFKVDHVSKMEIIDAGFNSAIKGQYFDNGYANMMDLYSLGVKDEQIKNANLDTFSDERFYSADQKTPVGRLVSLIILK